MGDRQSKVGDYHGGGRESYQTGYDSRVGSDCYQLSSHGTDEEGHVRVEMLGGVNRDARLRHADESRGVIGWNPETRIASRLSS